MYETWKLVALCLNVNSLDLLLQKKFLCCLSPYALSPSLLHLPLHLYPAVNIRESLLDTIIGSQIIQVTESSIYLRMLFKWKKILPRCNTHPSFMKCFLTTVIRLLSTVVGIFYHLG